MVLRVDLPSLQGASGGDTQTRTGPGSHTAPLGPVESFRIMGAPLGFAVHNILLGSLVPKGAAKSDERAEANGRYWVRHAARGTRHVGRACVGRGFTWDVGRAWEAVGTSTGEGKRVM